jgi:glycerate-2-kinase
VRGRRLIARRDVVRWAVADWSLVAAGKAAATMARAAERVLGRRIDDALAVAPAGPPATAADAAHAGRPSPSRRRGRQAAEAVLRPGARPGPTTCCSSSSRAAPPPCCRPRWRASRLRGEGALTGRLMRRGATIQELNTVRKHLSR